MVAPTKAEIAKKQKDYQGFLSKVDDENRLSDKWAIATLRSAIRREWMRNPVKLAVLHEAMIPDMNPLTRTKWLYKCAKCGGLFKQSDVEVDHIKGEHSFKTIDDFESYWYNILRAKKEDLQVLCIPDHRIKTYAERYNLSWEEAVRRKVVIEKMNQTAAQQKKELKKYGFKPKDMTNADTREQCYIQLLDKGVI